jgi:hypothetical protein
MKFDVLLFVAVAVALAVEPALEFLTAIRGRDQ